MSPISLIRVLNRNKWYLISVPLLAALTVFFLTKNQKAEYETESVIYTGMVSGINLDSSSGSSTDFRVVNSGFDTLISTIRSKEMLRSVTLQLLANTVCSGTSYGFEEADWYPQFRDEYATSDVASCHEIVERMKADASDGSSLLYGLLHVSESEVDLAGIEKRLSVSRIGSSDLLEVRFKSSHADLAYDFLDALNASFIVRYQDLRQKEASSVVLFFEAEAARSYAALQVAVDKMRTFGAANRVINYQEQSKVIANQRENIDQQIQNERMRLESARSAVADLEKRIGANGSIQNAGANLIALRQQFADATARGMIESVSGSTTDSTSIALDALERDVTQGVEALYQARYSENGLVVNDLVGMWMQQVVAITEIEASLEVLETRKAEYIKTYDDFVPLGSELATIEREVDVAENEYLEVLNSLNEARMRQKNIEMSSSIEVLDPPSYPHDPLPSKAKILMALAFMAAFFSISGVVLGVELLDESLRSPAEAARKTGLKLVGFVPESRGDEDASKAEFDARCMNIMSARIKSYLSLKGSADTKLVCIVSAQSGDGKTVVADRLQQSLLNSGRNVINLTTRRTEAGGQDRPSAQYKVTEAYAGTRQVDQLMNLPEGEKVVILMELPAFSNNEMPLQLLESAAAVVWVARADTLWGGLEQDALEFLQDNSRVEPVLCLNRVQPERIEDSVGEMRKDRASLRRTTKKILNRNFS